MTTTFGDDLITKTNQAKIDACNARLDIAIRAASELESAVRWLVQTRAWQTLGYSNFIEMYEARAGFKCPTPVAAFALNTYRAEGLKGRGNRPGAVGHTVIDIAAAVGLPKTSARSMIAQLDAGVPANEVHRGPFSRQVHDGRSMPGRMQRQSRIAAGPDDYVSASFMLVRRDADQVRVIARDANVPESEIYRQAVAEYLMRHRESR